jgi:hypothetical protein
MRHRSPWFGILAVTMAMPGLALQADSAVSLVGNWHGTYTCTQGLTALDLSIAADNFSHVRATFHFNAVPSNRGVPEGCFTMLGTFEPGSRHIRLAPDDWILQPTDYIMVGLAGHLNSSGTQMTGRVTEAAACTSFSLRHVSFKPTAPDVCKTAATVATGSGTQFAPHWTSAAVSP